MARGRRQKSESRPDLIFHFLSSRFQEIQESVVFWDKLCVSPRVKLKDEVGPSNGSSHWLCPLDGGHTPWCNPWASRQPLSRCRRFAADFSCVFKVWNGKRSGSGDDLGTKTEKLFQSNLCSPARDQNQYACVIHVCLDVALREGDLGSGKRRRKK